MDKEQVPFFIIDNPLVQELLDVNPASYRVVELKAISAALGAPEEQQSRNSMTILNVERGLLIKFHEPGRKQGKTKLDIREIAL